jgi:hypothetical protein
VAKKVIDEARKPENQAKIKRGVEQARVVRRQAQGPPYLSTALRRGLAAARHGADLAVAWSLTAPVPVDSQFFGVGGFAM